MNTPKYTIITSKAALNIADTTEARLELIEEQNSKLESLGYNLNGVYVAHFFESAFIHEKTDSDTLSELAQKLATKEGYDLVQFENGKIGFVAYYGNEENGFEIVNSYEEIKEEVTEYINETEKEYKAEFIAMWKTCCDLCGWLDLDTPNTGTMIDIIMDYNNSLFNDGLKQILRGGEN